MLLHSCKQHVMHFPSILTLPPRALVQSCPVMRQSVHALKATATLGSGYSTCSGLLSTTRWLKCLVVQICNQAVLSMPYHPGIMWGISACAAHKDIYSLVALCWHLGVYLSLQFAYVLVLHMLACVDLCMLSTFEV